MPVFAVHRAFHIRTGQRAAGEAIDAWLSRHEVETISVADVYEACVYLLKHYECVPDLALLGTAWLTEDELSIVRYIRETWPRVGVVIYGGAAETPAFDSSPFTRICRSQAALERVLAEPPAHLLQQLCQQAAPARPLPAAPGLRREVDEPLRRPPAAHETRPADPTEGPQAIGDAPGGPAKASSAETDPPYAPLTAEELSALLERTDET